MTIKFYSVHGKYGEFSNFSNHPIIVDGKEYATSEHFFQAMKFAGTKYESKVRKAKGPMAAAMLGRDRSLPLRKDWEQVKISVMETALVAKFTQHKNLQELLLSTGNEKLVEHTENDSYWGDGGNGKGKNMLGILLMKVRAKLREQ